MKAEGERHGACADDRWRRSWPRLPHPPWRITRLRPNLPINLNLLLVTGHCTKAVSCADNHHFDSTRPNHVSARSLTGDTMAQRRSDAARRSAAAISIESCWISRPAHHLEAWPWGKVSTRDHIGGGQSFDNDSVRRRRRTRQT